MHRPVSFEQNAPRMEDEHLWASDDDDGLAPSNEKLDAARVKMHRRRGDGGDHARDQGQVARGGSAHNNSRKGKTASRTRKGSEKCESSRSPAEKGHWEGIDEFGADGNEASRGVGTVDEAEDEERRLEDQARHLEEKLALLREEQVMVAKKHEEVRIRKAARRELENFKSELQDEFDGVVLALSEEKNAKLKVAGSFKREIKSRIAELESMLTQLGDKVSAVTDLYDATVNELQKELAEAVNEREKTLEAELRDELAGRFATLRNSGENKFVGLV